MIVYSYINNKNEPVLLVYNPGEKEYKNITNNFSIRDIIKIVQIGDILTYTSHTKLIYDLEKDNQGNVIDAFILESIQGNGRAYINSKICKHKYEDDRIYTPYLSYLFLNNKLNTNLEEGLVQGSVSLSRLSSYTNWVNINNTRTRRAEYSILRIMQNDSKGNPVLKFKTTYPSYPNQFLYNDTLYLSKKNIDRYKFKHLFIEKTVNKGNNNIVTIGDILNYKLIIKNYSKKDYIYDLIIKEYIPEFVDFESHYENKNNIYFDYNKKNKTLIWNIGKLRTKEEIIIYYLVRVIKGKSGDKIESIGLVGNIPSSNVINIIGTNLNKNKKNAIIKNFNKLNKKLTGKRLINEIYKKSFHTDLKFDNFDIIKLINNTKLNSAQVSTIDLNINNSFYGSILNKYWSTLASLKYTYIQGDKAMDIYNMKYFGDYNYLKRREDFIYKETLQTGDILIYLNRNDATYSVDNNKLNKIYYTYEEGEYAYIYIENKGFVGVNPGDDGIKNTKSDRNEFNSKYYKDNNLTLYMFATNITEDLLEVANLQTLFGKDYYAILRPSLSFNYPNINESNNIIIIISLIFIFIILVCGVYLLLKYVKMKKQGKEFNFKNLNQELLINFKLNK